jgi:hypothetical protein
MLKEMAQQGVLFQIDDDVLKDIPKVQAAENCSYIDDTQWGDQFFNILKVFDRNPNLFKKIHVIHLRRGDKPAAEISKEWDGAIYLELSYQKVQKRDANKDEYKRKCPVSADTRDQVILTLLEWPDHDDIFDLLMKQPDREIVTRFTYNKRFLNYLAQRMTVFRLTPSLAAEKSLQGAPILPQILNKLSDEFKPESDNESQFNYVDRWLLEIDHNSTLGKHIKFFTSLQNQKLARGIALDNTSTGLSSAMSQQYASTYLFVSYRSRGGEYEYSSLNDLNQCLKDFRSSSTYWTKPQRYMHPGYDCDQE